MIVFSAFTDTAEYLYDNASDFVKKKYGLDTAVITGAIEGKTTVEGVKPTLNNVLTCFSPISKNKDVLMPNSTAEIDVLIATDCISEKEFGIIDLPFHDYTIKEYRVGQHIHACNWIKAKFIVNGKFVIVRVDHAEKTVWISERFMKQFGKDAIVNRIRQTSSNEDIGG